MNINMCSFVAFFKLAILFVVETEIPLAHVYCGVLPGSHPAVIQQCNNKLEISLGECTGSARFMSRYTFRPTPRLIEGSRTSIRRNPLYVPRSMNQVVFDSFDGDERSKDKSCEVHTVVYTTREIVR